jgi:hypothetical protein
MGEKRLAEAQAEERRREAEARAEQLATAISVIELEMKEVDAIMRKRQWEDARGRLAKLETLFAPLEVDAVGRGEALPAAVVAAKGRYESLRARFTKFESDVFEDAFRSLNAPDKSRATDEELMAAVARRHRVSPKYGEEV